VGQRTNRVEEPERLEHDVEKIRDALGEVVSELDRRRHELTDWKLQLRKHGGLLIAVGVGLASVIGLAVGIKVFRDRRKPRRRFNVSFRPPPPQPESFGHKVLSAGAAAAIGVVAKAVAKRAVGWADELPDGQRRAELRS
jgi:hypothetical protein